MKKLQYALLIVTLLSVHHAVAQWSYIYKLFKSGGKRTVYVIEKSPAGIYKPLSTIPYERFDYKDAFKKHNSTVIQSSETFKSREDFLSKTYDRQLKSETQASRLKSAVLQPWEIERQTINKKIKDIFLNYSVGRIFKDEKFLEPSLKEITAADVFISIPATDQAYRNIFKKYSLSDSKEMKSLQASLARDAKANKHIHLLPNERAFEHMLAETSSNNPIILIGHNEKGKFYFPDGSAKSFSQMDSLACRGTRSIIYLSCNAGFYTSNTAANFYLSYWEAIKLTKKINQKYLSSSNSIVESHTIQSILENHFNNKQKQQKVKCTVTIVAIGGVFYTFYQLKSTAQKHSSTKNPR